jgi:hypothetical protein
MAWVKTLCGRLRCWPRHSRTQDRRGPPRSRGRAVIDAGDKGSEAIPTLVIAGGVSISECEVTSVASRSTMSGSSLVAFSPGFRSAAASHARERNSRVHVPNPLLKRSGLVTVRSKNREIVAFEATFPWLLVLVSDAQQASADAVRGESGEDAPGEGARCWTGPGYAVARTWEMRGSGQVPLEVGRHLKHSAMGFR